MERKLIINSIIVWDNLTDSTNFDKLNANVKYIHNKSISIPYLSGYIYDYIFIFGMPMMMMLHIVCVQEMARREREREK